MSNRVMPRTMPETLLRQQCDSGSQGSRKPLPLEIYASDIAAKDRENRERQRAENEAAAIAAIAPIFKAAVAAYPGGQEAYAARLGLARSMVVEMCNGKTSTGAPRPIGQRDSYPLCEHAASWTIWVRGQAALGNLDAVIRQSTDLRYATVKDWIVEWVLRDKRTREKCIEDIAREHGRELEEVESVVEVGDDDAAPGEPMEHAGVTP